MEKQFQKGKIHPIFQIRIH